MLISYRPIFVLKICLVENDLNQLILKHSLQFFSISGCDYCMLESGPRVPTRETDSNIEFFNSRVSTSLNDSEVYPILLRIR